MTAASVTVTLPDGARSRPPRARRSATSCGTRSAPGSPRPPCSPRSTASRSTCRARSIATPSSRSSRPRAPRRSSSIRHDAAHIVADVGAAAVPRHAGHDRPVDRGRLLLRLRPRPAVHPEDDSRRSRRPRTRSSQRTCRSCAARSRSTRRSRCSTGKGEKFKVEIIEDIVAKGAKTLTLYSHGDWVDFCLGPHGPSTGRVGVIKLLQLVGGVLARRSPQHDAAADLRHRVLRQEGSRRVAQAARGGARSAITASSARSSTCSHFHPLAPGAAFWTAEGHGDLHGAVDAHAPACAGERLRRDQDAAALQQGAVGDVAATGASTRRTCSSSLDSEAKAAADRGRAPLLAQADELPVAPPVSTG